MTGNKPPHCPRCGAKVELYKGQDRQERILGHVAPETGQDCPGWGMTPVYYGLE